MKLKRFTLKTIALTLLVTFFVHDTIGLGGPEVVSSLSPSLTHVRAFMNSTFNSASRSELRDLMGIDVRSEVRNDPPKNLLPSWMNELASARLKSWQDFMDDSDLITANFLSDYPELAQARGRVTRLIYPAAHDDVNTVLSFIKVFPNVREVIIVSAYETTSADQIEEIWNKNFQDAAVSFHVNISKVTVRALKRNYYDETLGEELKKTRPEGITILIDKGPGVNASMRTEPQFRSSILRDTLPGDFIFSILYPFEKPLEWNGLPLKDKSNKIKPVTLPFLYHWQEKWSISKLSEADFEGPRSEVRQQGNKSNYYLKLIFLAAALSILPASNYAFNQYLLKKSDSIAVVVDSKEQIGEAENFYTNFIPKFQKDFRVILNQDTPKDPLAKLFPTPMIHYVSSYKLFEFAMFSLFLAFPINHFFQLLLAGSEFRIAKIRNFLAFTGFFFFASGALLNASDAILLHGVMDWFSGLSPGDLLIFFAYDFIAAGAALSMFMSLSSNQKISNLANPFQTQTPRSETRNVETARELIAQFRRSMDQGISAAHPGDEKLTEALLALTIGNQIHAAGLMRGAIAEYMKLHQLKRDNPYFAPLDQAISILSTDNSKASRPKKQTGNNLSEEKVQAIFNRLKDLTLSVEIERQTSDQAALDKIRFITDEAWNLLEMVYDQPLLKKELITPRDQLSPGDVVLHILTDPHQETEVSPMLILGPIKDERMKSSPDFVAFLNGFGSLHTVRKDVLSSRGNYYKLVFNAARSEARFLDANQENKIEGERVSSMFSKSRAEARELSGTAIAINVGMALYMGYQATRFILKLRHFKRENKGRISEIMTTGREFLKQYPDNRILGLVGVASIAKEKSRLAANFDYLLIKSSPDREMDRKFHEDFNQQFRLGRKFERKPFKPIVLEHENQEALYLDLRLSQASRWFVIARTPEEESKLTQMIEEELKKTDPEKYSEPNSTKRFWFEWGGQPHVLDLISYLGMFLVVGYFFLESTFSFVISGSDKLLSHITTPFLLASFLNITLEIFKNASYFGYKKTFATNSIVINTKHGTLASINLSDVFILGCAIIYWFSMPLIYLIPSIFIMYLSLRTTASLTIRPSSEDVSLLESDAFYQKVEKTFHDSQRVKEVLAGQLGLSIFTISLLSFGAFSVNGTNALVRILWFVPATLILAGIDAFTKYLAATRFDYHDQSQRTVEKFFEKISKALQELNKDFHSYQFHYEFKTIREAKPLVSREKFQQYKRKGFVVFSKEDGKIIYWINPDTYSYFSFTNLLKSIERKINIRLINPKPASWNDLRRDARQLDKILTRSEVRSAEEQKDKMSEEEEAPLKPGQVKVNKSYFKGILPKEPFLLHSYYLRNTPPSNKIKEAGSSVFLIETFFLELQILGLKHDEKALKALRHSVETINKTDAVHAVLDLVRIGDLPKSFEDIWFKVESSAEFRKEFIKEAVFRSEARFLDANQENKIEGERVSSMFSKSRAEVRLPFLIIPGEMKESDHLSDLVARWYRGEEEVNQSSGIEEDIRLLGERIEADVPEADRQTIMNDARIRVPPYMSEVPFDNPRPMYFSPLLHMPILLLENVKTALHNVAGNEAYKDLYLGWVEMYMLHSYGHVVDYNGGIRLHDPSHWKAEREALFERFKLTEDERQSVRDVQGDVRANKYRAIQAAHNPRLHYFGEARYTQDLEWVIQEMKQYPYIADEQVIRMANWQISLAEEGPGERAEQLHKEMLQTFNPDQLKRYEAFRIFFRDYFNALYYDPTWISRLKGEYKPVLRDPKTLIPLEALTKLTARSEVRGVDLKPIENLLSKKLKTKEDWISILKYLSSQIPADEKTTAKNVAKISNGYLTYSKVRAIVSHFSISYEEVGMVREIRAQRNRKEWIRYLKELVSKIPADQPKTARNAALASNNRLTTHDIGTAMSQKNIHFSDVGMVREQQVPKSKEEWILYLRSLVSNVPKEVKATPLNVARFSKGEITNDAIYHALVSHHISYQDVNLVRENDESRTREEWVAFLKNLVTKLAKDIDPTPNNVAAISDGALTVMQIYRALYGHNISYEEIGMKRSPYPGHSKQEWIAMIQSIIANLPEGVLPTIPNVAHASQRKFSSHQIREALRGHKIKFADVGLIRANAFAKSREKWIEILKELAARVPKEMPVTPKNVAKYSEGEINRSMIYSVLFYHHIAAEEVGMTRKYILGRTREEWIKLLKKEVSSLPEGVWPSIKNIAQNSNRFSYTQFFSTLYRHSINSGDIGIVPARLVRQHKNAVQEIQQAISRQDVKEAKRLYVKYRNLLIPDERESFQTIIYQMENPDFYKFVWEQSRNLMATLANESDSKIMRRSTELREEFKGRSTMPIAAYAIALFSEVVRRIIEESKNGKSKIDPQIIEYIGGAPTEKQIQGALSLLNHKTIVGMLPSEGKTLTVGLAAYLKVLSGVKVEVHDWDNHLSARDVQMEGAILSRLGMTVATVLDNSEYIFNSAPNSSIDSPFPHLKAIKVNKMSGSPLLRKKQKAFRSDVVYGPYEEMIFYWMRDWFGLIGDQEKVHPVGEPSWILVEEADTPLLDAIYDPLIVSSAGKKQYNKRLNFYKAIYEYGGILQKGKDYRVGRRKIQLQNKKKILAGLEQFIKGKIDEPKGVSKRLISESELSGFTLEDLLISALEIQNFYEKGRDYIILEDEVILIDEHTGELRLNRRLMKRMHTFLEIKEEKNGVKIRDLNKIDAVMTTEEFYNRIPGFSGVIGILNEEEKVWLSRLYAARTVSIDPQYQNHNHRLDLPDRYFLTEEEKLRYIGRLVQGVHKTGKPILINVSSPNEALLIKNYLINEKFVENPQDINMIDAQIKEDDSVWNQIGEERRITITAQRASRGQEIKLKDSLYQPVAIEIDGHSLVIGGLFVIGTHRGKTKRVETQLRDRAARRGRMGATQVVDHIKGNAFLKQYASYALREFLKRSDLDSDLAAPLFEYAREKRLRSLMQRHKTLRVYYKKLVASQFLFNNSLKKAIIELKIDPNSFYSVRLKYLDRIFATIEGNHFDLFPGFSKAAVTFQEAILKSIRKSDQAGIKRALSDFSSAIDRISRWSTRSEVRSWKNMMLAAAIGAAIFGAVLAYQMGNDAAEMSRSMEIERSAYEQHIQDLNARLETLKQEYQDYKFRTPDDHWSVKINELKNALFHSVVLLENEALNDEKRMEAASDISAVMLLFDIDISRGEMPPKYLPYLADIYDSVIENIAPLLQDPNPMIAAKTNSLIQRALESVKRWNQSLEKAPEVPRPLIRDKSKIFFTSRSEARFPEINSDDLIKGARPSSTKSRAEVRKKSNNLYYMFLAGAFIGSIAGLFRGVLEDAGLSMAFIVTGISLLVLSAVTLPYIYLIYQITAKFKRIREGKQIDPNVLMKQIRFKEGHVHQLMTLMQHPLLEEALERLGIEKKSEWLLKLGGLWTQEEKELKQRQSLSHRMTNLQKNWRDMQAELRFPSFIWKMFGLILRVNRHLNETLSLQRDIEKFEEEEDGRIIDYDTQIGELQEAIRQIEDERGSSRRSEVRNYTLKKFILQEDARLDQVIDQIIRKQKALGHSSAQIIEMMTGGEEVLTLSDRERKLAKGTELLVKLDLQPKLRSEARNAKQSKLADALQTNFMLIDFGRALAEQISDHFEETINRVLWYSEVERENISNFAQFKTGLELLLIPPRKIDEASKAKLNAIVPGLELLSRDALQSDSSLFSKWIEQTNLYLKHFGATKKLSETEFKDAVYGPKKVNEFFVQHLKDLLLIKQKLGIRFGLVANFEAAGRDYIENFLNQHFPGLFDPKLIFISGEAGVTKEHDAFFAKAIDRYQDFYGEPKEIIFLDNQAIGFDPAKVHGIIHHIHYGFAGDKEAPFRDAQLFDASLRNGDSPEGVFRTLLTEAKSRSEVRSTRFARSGQTESTRSVLNETKSRRRAEARSKTPEGEEEPFAKSKKSLDRARIVSFYQAVIRLQNQYRLDIPTQENFDKAELFPDEFQNIGKIAAEIELVLERYLTGRETNPDFHNDESLQRNLQGIQARLQSLKDQITSLAGKEITAILLTPLIKPSEAGSDTLEIADPLHRKIIEWAKNRKEQETLDTLRLAGLHPDTLGMLKITNVHWGKKGDIYLGSKIQYNAREGASAHISIFNPLKTPEGFGSEGWGKEIGLGNHGEVYQVLENPVNETVAIVVAPRGYYRKGASKSPLVIMVFKWDELMQHTHINPENKYEDLMYRLGQFDTKGDFDQEGLISLPGAQHVLALPNSRYPVLTWSLDGRKLITAVENCKIIDWDISKNIYTARQLEIPKQNEKISIKETPAISLSPTGNFVALFYGRGIVPEGAAERIDPFVEIWDLGSAKLVAKLDHTVVAGVDWDSEENLIFEKREVISGFASGGIYRWRWSKGLTLEKIIKTDLTKLPIKISPNGRFLAVTDKGRYVRVVDLQTLKEIKTELLVNYRVRNIGVEIAESISLKDSAISELSWSSDSSHIAAGHDGRLAIWQVIDSRSEVRHLNDKQENKIGSGQVPLTKSRAEARDENPLKALKLRISTSAPKLYVILDPKSQVSQSIKETFNDVRGVEVQIFERAEQFIGHLNTIQVALSTKRQGRGERKIAAIGVVIDDSAYSKLAQEIRRLDPNQDLALILVGDNLNVSSENDPLNSVRYQTSKFRNDFIDDLKALFGRYRALTRNPNSQKPGPRKLTPTQIGWYAQPYENGPRKETASNPASFERPKTEISKKIEEARLNGKIYRFELETVIEGKRVRGTVNGKIMDEFEEEKPSETISFATLEPSEYEESKKLYEAIKRNGFRLIFGKEPAENQFVIHRMEPARSEARNDFESYDASSLLSHYRELDALLQDSSKLAEKLNITIIAGNKKNYDTGIISGIAASAIGMSLGFLSFYPNIAASMISGVGMTAMFLFLFNRYVYAKPRSQQRELVHRKEEIRNTIHELMQERLDLEVFVLDWLKMSNGSEPTVPMRNDAHSQTRYRFQNFDNRVSQINAKINQFFIDTANIRKGQEAAALLVKLVLEIADVAELHKEDKDVIRDILARGDREAMARLNAFVQIYPHVRANSHFTIRRSESRSVSEKPNRKFDTLRQIVGKNISELSAEDIFKLLSNRRYLKVSNESKEEVAAELRGAQRFSVNLPAFNTVFQIAIGLHQSLKNGSWMTVKKLSRGSAASEKEFNLHGEEAEAVAKILKRLQALTVRSEVRTGLAPIQLDEAIFKQMIERIVGVTGSSSRKQKNLEETWGTIGIMVEKADKQKVSAEEILDHEIKPDLWGKDFYNELFNAVRLLEAVTKFVEQSEENSLTALEVLTREINKNPAPQVTAILVYVIARIASKFQNLDYGTATDALLDQLKRAPDHSQTGEVLADKIKTHINLVLQQKGLKKEEVEINLRFSEEGIAALTPEEMQIREMFMEKIRLALWIIAAQKSHWGTVIQKTLAKIVETDTSNIQYRQLVRILLELMPHKDFTDYLQHLDVEKTIQILVNQFHRKLSPPVFDLFAEMLARFIFDSPKAKELFEKYLYQFIFERTSKKSGLRKKRTLYYDNAKDLLSQKMPTFVQIMKDSEKAKRFLTVLSLLRRIYPANKMNRLPETSVALAEKSKSSFIQLGEFRIVSFSESFRRHILYVPGAEGETPFAIELKIPGDQDVRTAIWSNHFKVAKELWTKYPKNPGVVKPLFFASYTGTFPMYGKEYHFFEEEPLGIAAFLYEDGKRVMNIFGERDGYSRFSGKPAIPGYLEKIADQHNMSVTTLVDQMVIQTIATAIRLHRLGYRGDIPARKNFAGMNDMHSENIRLVERTARTENVGDFGAFEKVKKLSSKAALEEILHLIEFREKPIASIVFLLSHIVNELLLGIEDPREKLKLLRQAKHDLHGILPREQADQKIPQYERALLDEPIQALTRLIAEQKALQRSEARSTSSGQDDFDRRRSEQGENTPRRMTEAREISEERFREIIHLMTDTVQEVSEDTWKELEQATPRQLAVIGITLSAEIRRLDIFANLQAILQKRSERISQLIRTKSNLEIRYEPKNPDTERSEMRSEKADFESFEAKVAEIGRKDEPIYSGHLMNVYGIHNPREQDRALEILNEYGFTVGPINAEAGGPIYQVPKDNQLSLINSALQTALETFPKLRFFKTRNPRKYVRFLSEALSPLDLKGIPRYKRLANIGGRIAFLQLVMQRMPEKIENAITPEEAIDYWKFTESLNSIVSHLEELQTEIESSRSEVRQQDNQDGEVSKKSALPKANKLKDDMLTPEEEKRWEELWKNYFPNTQSISKLPDQGRKKRSEARANQFNKMNPDSSELNLNLPIAEEEFDTFRQDALATVDLFQSDIARSELRKFLTQGASTDLNEGLVGNVYSREFEKLLPIVGAGAKYEGVPAVQIVATRSELRQVEEINRALGPILFKGKKYNPILTAPTPEAAAKLIRSELGVTSVRFNALNADYAQMIKDVYASFYTQVVVFSQSVIDELTSRVSGLLAIIDRAKAFTDRIAEMA